MNLTHRRSTETMLCCIVQRPGIHHKWLRSNRYLCRCLLHQWFLAMIIIITITRMTIEWLHRDSIVESRSPTTHIIETSKITRIWNNGMEIIISNVGEEEEEEGEDIIITVKSRRFLFVSISHYIVCTYRFNCFFVFLSCENFLSLSNEMDGQIGTQKTKARENETDETGWKAQS